MMRRTMFAWALAAVVALAAACSDGTGPAADLSADEVDFLALSIDQASDSAAGDAFALGSVSGPPTIPPPDTWSFSFGSTRACPEGGELTVAGSGDFARDAFAGTSEMTFLATTTIDACAFLRDDVTFTVNGDATLDVHWLRVDKDLVEAERNLEGTIRVTTSDGRFEECSFAIHSVFDPESGRVLVSGEACGRTIDRTWMRG